MRIPGRTLESMPLLVVLIVLPVLVVYWTIRGLVQGVIWSSRHVGAWIGGAQVQPRRQRERLARERLGEP
jgi:hypothetical protein